MKPTKDTIMCISISERPGDFGSNFFNMAFEKMSLDFIYKPFSVEAKNLSAAIDGVRALKIRGCGVSMPHKQKVLEYLDEVDGVAQKIGAVNTIVNDNGRLIGYNTDYYGVLAVLREIPQTKDKKVLVIGAGGVSRAVIMALKELNVSDITLISRDNEYSETVAVELNVSHALYMKKAEISADILVNATPVGMSPDDELIIIKEDLKRYQTVIDVVVSKIKTRLNKVGEDLGLQVIPGYKIAINQAVSQFKLYTGLDLPQEVIENFIKEYPSNQ